METVECKNSSNFFVTDYKHAIVFKDLLKDHHTRKQQNIISALMILTIHSLTHVQSAIVTKYTHIGALNGNVNNKFTHIHTSHTRFYACMQAPLFAESERILTKAQ